MYVGFELAEEGGPHDIVETRRVRKHFPAVPSAERATNAVTAVCPLPFCIRFRSLEATADNKALA